MNDISIRLLAEALIEIATRLTPLQRQILSLMCEAPDNTLSGGEIAQKLGLKHHAIVTTAVTQLAKGLIALSGVVPPRGSAGAISWWRVLFSNPSSTDKHRGFLWRLRPGLRDAAIECGIGCDYSVTSLPAKLQDEGAEKKCLTQFRTAGKPRLPSGKS